MLENLFSAFLGVSLSTAAIILVILCLDKIFAKNYTAKWKYILWLVIVIRLMIPVQNVQSIITLPAPDSEIVISAAQTVDTTSFERNNPTVTEIKNDTTAPFAPVGNEEPLTPGEAFSPVPQPGVLAASGSTLSVMELASIIWVVGAALFLLYHITAYLAFRVNLKRWYRLNSDHRPQQIVDWLKAEKNIKRKIAVKFCSKIASPMTVGLLKPVILLPNIKYTEEQLFLILSHELIHIKRLDIGYKFLVVAANAMHFFNPLIYLMVKSINRDMEISCDEEVVKGREISYRQEYSRTMLGLMRENKIRQTAFSTYFYDHKKGFIRRIKAMIDIKAKKKGFASLCLVGITAVVLAGTLVACAYEGAAEPIFPVQKKHDYDYPSGEVEGKLILDDNCLRLVISGDISYLLIWPHGFSLNLMGDEIEIINAEGKAVAQVGDDIWVGGGEVPAGIVEKYTGRSVPENYKSPYWLVAEYSDEKTETEEPENGKDENEETVDGEVVYEYPEITDLTFLTAVEEDLYQEYSSAHDDSLLASLEPLMICRFYLHANTQGDRETAYSLCIQEEGHLVISREEYIDAPGWTEWEEFVGVENVKVRVYTKFGSENAVVTWQNREVDPDEGLFTFGLVKDSEDIWRVRFLPMQ